MVRSWSFFFWVCWFGLTCTPIIILSFPIVSINPSQLHRVRQHRFASKTNFQERDDTSLEQSTTFPGMKQTLSPAPTTIPLSHDDDNNNLQVSFSHIHLYVDHLKPLKEYKKLEAALNDFDMKMNTMETNLQSTEAIPSTLQQQQWQESCFENGIQSQQNVTFVSQNRDIVQQFLVGLGFRITGYGLYASSSGYVNYFSPNPIQSSSSNHDNEDFQNVSTQSLLITSRDKAGVQIVVTAPNHGTIHDISNINNNKHIKKQHYLDAENLQQFFQCHGGRQGIAVLGFQVNNVEYIYKQYQTMHPSLIHSYRTIPSTSTTLGKKSHGCQMLQVYAYYHGNEKEEPDRGTILRFIEPMSSGPDDGDGTFCILPGLAQVDATFDRHSSAAYCDHWVSNVVGRTDFLQTLQDTLGFTPKVDFNAGVVAAGEAQIESTVIGNTSPLETTDKQTALRDQSQVYLPTNNALSSVGHVHGFLQEVGQGIQHIASRVENLVDFVQRCNDMRAITGEGFTFLSIPRSYYGILSVEYLANEADIPISLSHTLLEMCRQHGIVDLEDASVDLDLDQNELERRLDAAISSNNHAIDQTWYWKKRNTIVPTILRSRYCNLYNLLRDHCPNVEEDWYLRLVRNHILVDVQGKDILFQIFTSNILQRESHEEAPFLEFIQRECFSTPTRRQDGKNNEETARPIKAGCGGFGIRNFLTLFLSIELSKAMLEVSDAAPLSKSQWQAEQRVACLTNQLMESNPILTEISNAMTDEGTYQEKMQIALLQGDTLAAKEWDEKRKLAQACKLRGNQKLMACSAKYQMQMRQIQDS